MDLAWMRACAEDGIVVAAACSQEAPGHLRARGIVGTEKQRPLWQRPRQAVACMASENSPPMFHLPLTARGLG
jgi:hypothetical protein